jgi:N,N'-diacetyllegionaminate synthase
MRIWAEAGPCEGSVNYGIRAADAVARAGADALKVQWYRPDMLVTRDAARYDRTDHAGKETQWEAFQGALWPYDRWQPVKDRCDQLGIGFIPSVFDGDAVQAALEMGVTTLKIASGDITHGPLIDMAARAGKQVVVSTGASTMAEVRRAYTWASSYGAQVTLLACHLQYPTPHESAHLGRILALQQEFAWAAQKDQVRIGYSDHTPGPQITGFLAALGCQVHEKHFSLHPGDGGGDHDFAVGPDGLADMVKMAQAALTLIGNVELEPSSGEQAARIGARRSLYLRRAVTTHISPDDLTALRPYDEEGYEPWEIAVLFPHSADPIRITHPMGEGELLRRAWVGTVGGTLTVVDNG